VGVSPGLSILSTTAAIFLSFFSCCSCLMTSAAEMTPIPPPPPAAPTIAPAPGPNTRCQRRPSSGIRSDNATVKKPLRSTSTLLRAVKKHTSRSYPRLHDCTERRVRTQSHYTLHYILHYIL
jgi:hypothetical protein